MSEELKPNQALFLWNLLAAETEGGREPTLSQAKPKLTPRERSLLVDGGYIEVERRGRSQHILLQDRAWAWAERSEQVQFASSSAGAEALEGLLHRLLPFLREHQVPLAKLLGAVKPSPAAGANGAENAAKKPSTRRKSSGRAQPKKAAPPKAQQTSSVEPTLGRDLPTLALLIEQACLRITGGRRKERVALRTLRDKLETIPRAELDATLRQLQRDGKLVLFREDNTPALTQADHDAALLVGDSPRHIVYLEN